MTLITAQSDRASFVTSTPARPMGVCLSS